MKEVFRDARTSYLERDDAAVVNADIIDLCRSRSGPRLLDYGCAAGAYCVALRKLGFTCVGVDSNKEYVARALKKGVVAFAVTDVLPFKDRSFDTVLLVEVLEHVEDPGRLLAEARRVARNNVLITVPDAGRFEELKRLGLTYEHMLERDHVRLFTKTELARLLGAYFDECVIWEAAPRYIHYLLPWYFRKPLTFCAWLGLLKPAFYARIHAECRTGSAQ